VLSSNKWQNFSRLAQKHNNKFYKESILKYGISAQGVHWNSEFSQYKRFEVLSAFIKNDINQSTIVDVGCGMGEYYNYLMDNDLAPKAYLGIDCEEQMISIAKKRYPRTDFKVQNVLTDSLLESDYYICSGAMNILEKEEFFSFLAKCYEKSIKGFAFNFLKKESFTNVSKEEVLEFCIKLSPNLQNIQTQEDYLDNDYSIFLRKDNP